MIVHDFSILLKNDFLELRHKEINEEVVLNILNLSKYIFFDNGNFSRIINQSNSESDFESKNGFKLDSKIILPGKFWEKWNHSKDPSNFQLVNEFINIMNNDIEEIDEFFRTVPSLDACTSREYIKDSILRALNKGKNIILFFPYPLNKYKTSFTNMFDDSLQRWLSILVFNFIGKQRIFVLTLTMENCFYLYEIGKESIHEFIDYDFSKYLLVINSKIHIE